MCKKIFVCVKKIFILTGINRTFELQTVTGLRHEEHVTSDFRAELDKNYDHCCHPPPRVCAGELGDEDVPLAAGAVPHQGEGQLQRVPRHTHVEIHCKTSC